MAINSGFSHEKWMIFHSYVKLPEGNLYLIHSVTFKSFPDSCWNTYPGCVHKLHIDSHGNSQSCFKSQLRLHPKPSHFIPRTNHPWHLGPPALASRMPLSCWMMACHPERAKAGQDHVQPCLWFVEVYINKHTDVTIYYIDSHIYNTY